MIPHRREQICRLALSAGSARGRLSCGPRPQSEQLPAARVSVLLAKPLWRHTFGGCGPGRPAATNRLVRLVAAGRPSNGFFRRHVRASQGASRGRARLKTRRAAPDSAGLAACPQLLRPLRGATRRAHCHVDSPSPHRCSPLGLLAHNHRNALRFTHAAHPCARRAFVCTRGDPYR
jgi:hypothetical protein